MFLSNNMSMIMCTENTKQPSNYMCRLTEKCLNVTKEIFIIAVLLNDDGGRDAHFSGITAYSAISYAVVVSELLTNIKRCQMTEI